jgi:hypothetical protein
MHTDLDTQAQACSERLRRLPSEVAPPYNWQEFQRRTQQRIGIPQDRLDWRHAVAAAVLVLIVGGVAVWSRVGMIGFESTDYAARAQAAAGRSGANEHAVAPNRASPGSGDHEDAGTSQDTVRDTQGPGNNAQGPGNNTRGSGNNTRSQPADDDALSPVSDATRLMQVRAAHARALEVWLASLPKEPAVVRVGARADVAGLEDRIAQVDDLLTSARLEKTQPDRLEALQLERVRLVGSLAQVRYAEYMAAASP